MRRTPPTLQQMPKTENRGKTLSLYIGKFLDKTATSSAKRGETDQLVYLKTDSRHISFLLSPEKAKENDKKFTHEELQSVK